MLEQTGCNKQYSFVPDAILAAETNTENKVSASPTDSSLAEAGCFFSRTCKQ